MNITEMLHKVFPILGEASLPSNYCSVIDEELARNLTYGGAAPVVTAITLVDSLVLTSVYINK